MTGIGEDLLCCFMGITGKRLVEPEDGVFESGLKEVFFKRVSDLIPFSGCDLIPIEDLVPKVTKDVKCCFFDVRFT